MQRARTNSSAVEESRPRVELIKMSNEAFRGRGKYSLVPAPNLRPRRECLSNGHPLLLSPADTTDGIIPDLCVLYVAQAKHSREYASKVLNVIGPSITLQSGVFLGSTRLRGEVECFTDCERWEMNIIFGAIYDISPMMCMDF